MSLRDRMQGLVDDRRTDLYERFGILSNPFPASHQTAGHPRSPSAVDKNAEDRVIEFFGDDTSQVIVVEGTQGVGKTNFLNHFESEISDALQGRPGYYVVRYLADPEVSFDGTTRRLIEELSREHLKELVEKLKDESDAIEVARSHDMRAALRGLVRSDEDNATQLMTEWLHGERPLRRHRDLLRVQFRLDTVESKTAALRDLAEVSGRAGVLKGVFLLLDEIEKQGGVLGVRPRMRYLTALRAMIDALPRRLFLVIAVTPDALLRYSKEYPALRSRLQDRLELKPLNSPSDAKELADFYLAEARGAANREMGQVEEGRAHILSQKEIRDCFVTLEREAEKGAYEGVPQREFLHALHRRAEEKL